MALWALTDSPRLSQKARDMVMSPGITVWISTAVIWEVAIKHAMNPTVMPVSAKDARYYFQDPVIGSCLFFRPTLKP